MKKFIGTLTKGNRWLIGIVLFCLFSSWVSVPSITGTIASGAAMIVLVFFLFLCRSVPSAPSAKEKAEAEKRRADAERELLLKQIESDARKSEAEEAAAKRRELLEYQKRQLEIEEKKLQQSILETDRLRLQLSQSSPAPSVDPPRGYIRTKLVGVTFPNDDGTSRQDALKRLDNEEDLSKLSIEIYDYNGEDAIRVLYDGVCCGNLPRDVVPEILSVKDQIDCCRINAESFITHDYDNAYHSRGKRIYRADFTVVYFK